MSESTEEPAKAPPAAGGTGTWIDSRFEVKDLIGSGGVGDVYMAWDHHLNRSVAVKRMRGELGEDERRVVEQMWREAMTTACLQHPNIVTIFDYGIDKHGAYVIMELIEGETLETILGRGPLQFEDFHRFAQQSLEALVAAHTSGLVHRDLKPGNFMLTHSTSHRFHVKILDFGLAKYLDRPRPQSLDHLNSLMGSVHYMAPEQFQRKPIDCRTDLYSMGCIYYEMVTGHAAFEGETVSQLIDAHLRVYPYLISTLRPDIAPKLETWVNDFIHKDPTRRHQTALEALLALPPAVDCARRPRAKTGPLYVD